MEIIQQIDVERVYLDLENPRHDPFKTEQEAINFLCAKEQVIELARDIALNGINPLEVFGLVEDGVGSKRRQSVYIAAEGNRRLCAIKLMNDPDSAPPEFRSEFTALASNWAQVSQIPAIVFAKKEDVKIWLERIHGGQLNGIGRRTWNAEQKERFSGGDRNKLALAILDYAEVHGLISTDDRRKRLTTAQRFLSNVLFRNELGIKFDKSGKVATNRTPEDFRILLKAFISDLLDGQVVNSRATKATIDIYAYELRENNPLLGGRVEPTELSGEPNPRRSKTSKAAAPVSPDRPKHLFSEREIVERLSKLENQKLKSLYYSICAVSIKDHTPLVAIGVWAFIESLTALIGKNEGTSFPDFLSFERLATLKVGQKESTKTIRQALQRVSQNGNATKHHMISAEYNDLQLVNDLATIKLVLVACLDEAIRLA